MPKKTYHIEHQRLVAGEGYCQCQPHAASRVVVIETTLVPAKNGRKRYFFRKNVQVFSGGGAAARADRLCAALTASTKRSPRIFDRFRQRGVYARSCTIKEYDEIMDRKREEGSY